MKKPLAGMLAIITALSLTACGKSENDNADAPDDSATTSQAQTTEKDATDNAEEAPVEEEPAPAPEPAPEPAQSGSSNFKEYMDSYEAYIDEYVAFMQKYKDGGQPVSMLADYMDMLQKQQEMTDAFNSYDQSQLSNEELQYYLEVQNRVNQKLLSVANM